MYGKCLKVHLPVKIFILLNEIFLTRELSFLNFKHVKFSFSKLKITVQNISIHVYFCETELDFPFRLAPFAN